VVANPILFAVRLEDSVYLTLELKELVHLQRSAIAQAISPDVGMMWEVFLDINKSTPVQVAYEALLAEPLKDGVDDINYLLFSNISQSLLCVCQL